MPIDLNQFKGLTPYASELFGIYQPILGWKGRRKRLWISRHQIALLRAATSRLRTLGPSRKALLANPKPTGPDDVAPREIEAWADTTAGRALQEAAIAFVEKSKRLPAGDDWAQIVKAAAFDKVLTGLARAQSGPTTARRKTTGMKREAAVAGALQHLATVAPDALHSALKLDRVVWPFVPAITDPLASFDPTTQRAILSPIGLINVFRQYFYEFDTFLGPAVGHVWVSPGGTLEVYEVHTKRTLEERTVEIGQTATASMERESKEDTEISTKVNEKNSQDINLGISAEGGVNVGVYQAKASASFDMSHNQEVAQETAHKQARSQSEKVASEIRREFKTTFKTTVEVTDVSSRRYVLQNTTDKLVNYELRRKMRRVGVQLQHIGTQLCWQVFVDDPGRALGISTLVHASAPEELVNTPPPEAPPALEAKKETVIVNFPFEPLDEEARDDGEDEEYEDGVEAGESEGKIRHTKTVDAQPPANGYTLQSAAVLSHAGTNPEEDQPLKVATECNVTGDQQFQLVLKYVDFNDQPSINFTIELLWKPPAESPETKQAYEDAKTKYNEETKKAAHRALVKEIRERVNNASRIEPRPSEELRQEERTVIFRRLIRELMDLPVTTEPHLMSELIRAIFDVDKMLYYVAQEWWRPRALQGQRVGDTTQLTADDRVSWGGDAEFGRPNYMITETSDPAPMGASLGWLLQLDGDNHRNAFLNSPWVKAVLPIRPGREAAAINWLKQADVEGAGDLDARYGGTEPGLAGKTIGEAAMALAENVTSQESSIENTLATEKVFEKGFDPLEGGFRATGAAFEVFDQWVEVLPTDQVVAVEYQPPPIVPVP